MIDHQRNEKKKLRILARTAQGIYHYQGKSIKINTNARNLLENEEWSETQVKRATT